MVSLVDPFCYLCFTFVFFILSCLFLAALLSPAGTGLASWLSCVGMFPCVLSLSHIVHRVMCGVSIPDMCLLLNIFSIVEAIYI